MARLRQISATAGVLLCFLLSPASWAGEAGVDMDGTRVPAGWAGSGTEETEGNVDGQQDAGGCLLVPDARDQHR